MSVPSKQTKAAPARPEPAAPGPVWWRVVPEWAWAAAGMLGLTLVLFGEVLFGARGQILSQESLDLFDQFVHWRAFGFNELRQGHLTLWNPHIFCGAPFLGGFQSALFYPLNALFLVLPLAAAINGSIALHVFLGGMFTYLWIRHRGVGGLAAFLGGALWVCSGPYFYHIYAGHLPNLCTMVWTPLVLLAVDGWFARPALRWLLLGVSATAMQVLAGHPQYVFYTGLAAALYSALQALAWWREQAPAPDRGRRALKLGGGLVLMAGGGLALSAVQWLPGLEASRETLRSTGLSFEQAAAYSYPPENLLTLLAPGFFGNMRNSPYWGRCDLWEMCLHVGVMGLVLAVVGARLGERKARRFALPLALLFLVLALGAHTPVFGWLYAGVPGFDKFRGSSKFVFLVSLFLSLLAACGLDALRRRERVSWGWMIGLLIGAALLVGAGAWVGKASGALPHWESAIQTMVHHKEFTLPAELYQDSRFLSHAREHAWWSLALAASWLAGAGVLLGLSRRWTWPGLLLGLLGLAEIVVFARVTLVAKPLDLACATELRNFVREHPGEHRILNLGQGLGNNNAAMSLGAYDVWGSDPGVMRRYAEFMACLQGVNPDRADVFMPLTRTPGLFGLLRCRYVLTTPGGQLQVRTLEGALPRFQLVGRSRVVAGRDAIFQALKAPGFDPRAEVLLEAEPEPKPGGAATPGTVRCLEAGPDHAVIEADLESPAVLLVTDAYSRGWRAQALAGSSQARYTVMPANYCLQGVPLGVGHHRFRLEYRPGSFVAGAWISGLALVAFVGAGVGRWWQRRRMKSSWIR